ncbi:MAG: hypothetical protein M5U34_08305 [Chloroflexi bacterium]|nr:hypothetical protein [Chloroflexota bacterium]
MGDQARRLTKAIPHRIAPTTWFPPFRLANETQNIRARQFVGAMQPGVILV